MDSGGSLALPDAPLEPWELNEDRDDGRLFNPDLYVPSGDPWRQAEILAYAFVAEYDNRGTARGHLQACLEFIGWMKEAVPGIRPISNDVRRAHLSVYKQGLISIGRTPATITRKLSVLAMFYRYLIAEGFVDRDPTVGMRRPKVSNESTRPYLDPRELADLINLAEHRAETDGDDYSRNAFALVALLALNALRVSEPLTADIEDLRRERYTDFLKVTRKGPKVELIPIHQRTLYAIRRSIGDRTSGPILLNRRGRRMGTVPANDVVKDLVAAVAPDKAGTITCHGIRHSSITALAYTGADPENVREFAGHADLRTTKRYVRRTTPPDAHGTFALAGSLASYPTSLPTER